MGRRHGFGNTTERGRSKVMLHMALVFLVMRYITTLFRSPSPAPSIAIAKFLAGLFLVLFLVFLILGHLSSTNASSGNDWPAEWRTWRDSEILHERSPPVLLPRCCWRAAFPSSRVPHSSARPRRRGRCRRCCCRGWPARCRSRWSPIRIHRARRPGSGLPADRARGIRCGHRRLQREAIILTPDQALAWIRTGSSRSSAIARRRKQTRWLVPVEFISRALS